MAASFALASLAMPFGVNGHAIQNINCDRLLSRGAGRWHTMRRITSGSSTALSMKNFAVPTAIAASSNGIVKTRFRFRLPTVYPNVARCLFSFNGGGSTNQNGGILVDTDGTLKCWTNISTSYVAGTASAAVPLGVADNGGWVTVEFTGTAVNNGTSDTIAAAAEITFADGSTASLPTTTSSPLSMGATLQFTTFNLGNVPTSTGFTSSWIGHIDFCDWVLLAATNADVASMGNLPPDGEWSIIPLTGNGSLTTLPFSTGAGWWNLNRTWVVSTSDGKLTSGTDGLRADFTHAGVSGRGATTVHAYKVTQVAVATGGGTPPALFMINGASLAADNAGNLGGEPSYTDHAGMSASTFDAMTFGVESNLTAGGTFDCNQIFIEAIHDGARFTEEELNPGEGYQQDWLVWTGNGTDHRVLTGADFRAHAALIFAPGESTQPKMIVDVVGNATYQANGTSAQDAFFGFTADGLHIGLGLNANSQLYYALLLRDDGSAIFDTSGDEPVVTGYTMLFRCGGYPNQSDLVYNFGDWAVPMEPQAMILYPARLASSASGGFTFDSMGSTMQALAGSGAGATNTTAIASLDSNGFTTLNGTTGIVGNNSPAPWLCFSNNTSLDELVRRHEANGYAQNANTYNYVPPYRFTFEDDSVATRPTMGTPSHQLFGPTISSGTISSAVVDTGCTDLLVITQTYNLGGGTRTVTWNSASMTPVYSVFGSNMGTEVWLISNPTPGTGPVVWTSSASASRLSMTVYPILGSAGIRNMNAREGVLTVEVGTRLKDLVVGMFTSDALDAGSTYALPGGATSLYNDGSVAQASVGFTMPGETDGMVSCTITETGGPDVYHFVMIAMMPAGIPAWNPYLSFFKDRRTSAPVASYRIDGTPHTGTDDSTSWSSQATNDNGIGINEMTDYFVGLNPMAVPLSAGTVSMGAGNCMRQNGSYGMSFGYPGVIVAVSPPTGIDDAYDCDFNTILSVPVDGVLTNDLANGGGAMTVDALVDDVTHGVSTLNSDGSFTYTPDTDYVGIDTFTYHPTTVDGGVGTLATVTITVLASVTPPVLDFRNRGPLAWIEWKDSNGTQFRWSDRPIGNAPEPNENRKERKILKWGDVQAMLSNDDGHPAGSSFDCETTDIDRGLRTIMATESTRYLWGQPLDVWCTTIEARAAGIAPQRIYRGRMQQPRRLPNRRAKLRAEDIISTMSDPAIMARDIPRRRLQFQLSDTKQFNNAEPIIYGDVNSTGLPHAGVIQPIYLMDHTIDSQLYRLFMVAGHACKSVTCYYKGDLIPDSCFSDGLIFAPGKPGWPYGTYDPIIDVAVGPVGTTYIEHAGRRYTVIAVRADQINPDDVDFLGVDVQGIETIGDGSGTLITNYFDAYYHFLVNFGLQSWQTGDWLDPPLWPDATDVVDQYYWNAAQAVTALRLGGAGYQVRAVIGANGQAATLQDWLRRWNVSGDCRMTIWDGQLQVHVPSRFVTITESIHEDVDLVGDPPEFSSDDSEFTTHYDLHGVPHFNLHRIEKNKWVQQQPSVVCVLSGRAVTNQNYPIVNPAERSYWMSEYDSALNAATEWLWRRRHPPQIAEFTMNFRGIYFPPGTYFNFTHREGEADLVTEPYMVESWSVKFETGTVEIKARLQSLGAMTDPIVITAGTFEAHDSSLGTTNDFPPPSWEV